MQPTLAGATGWTREPTSAVRAHPASRHVYFDEDSYEKAALIRRWAAERFSVELGNWNLEPRGPHVTPSFYFGFTNDLLPVIIPWLQGRGAARRSLAWLASGCRSRDRLVSPRAS